MIKDRLRNWARSVRLYPHYGHCYSLEHRYRSPQCWVADAPRLPPPSAYDIADAALVERAIANLAGSKHRRLFKLLYVLRFSDSMDEHRAIVRHRLRVPDLSEAENIAEYWLIQTLSELGEKRPENGTKSPAYLLHGKLQLTSDYRFVPSA